jgi:hypothetical protein
MGKRSLRGRFGLAGVWLLLWAGLLFPPAARASDGDSAIRSSGGKYFSERVELPVPAFSQSDPRWSEDPLGPTKDTLGYMGCTLTSVVMILNYYGVKTDPGFFNRYLKSHSGYDGDGYLAFGRVVDFAPKAIRLAYEGTCSYDSLDRNLLAGNPIIVQVRLEDGAMHFVVVAGKRGFDYLVCDPAVYPTGSLVPLGNVSSRIDYEYLFLRNGSVKEASR